MAGILTTAPIIARCFKLPRRSLPRLAIGASLNASFGLWGDALKLAYLAPYTSLGRQSQVATDDDLEGRDPAW